MVLSTQYSAVHSMAYIHNVPVTKYTCLIRMTKSGHKSAQEKGESYEWIRLFLNNKYNKQKQNTFDDTMT